MSKHTANTSRLDRVSIGASMPAVATALAAGLVAVSFVSQLTVARLNGSARADAKGEALVRLIADDFARGDLQRVDKALDALAPGAILVDASGAAVAGDASAPSTSPHLTTYPVMVDGQRAGVLVTPPLASLAPNLPAWLFLFLTGISVGGAYLASTFYARRISGDLGDLADYAAAIGAEDAPLPVGAVDFSELSRLRVAIQRAGHRVARQNDLLRRAAYRDGATGLPNAADMAERIRAGVAGATYETPAAFIHLEADFASGQDRSALSKRDLLAPMATRLLAEACDHLGRNNSEGVAIARMDGDYLGLFLPRVATRAGVSALLRALRRAATPPIEIGERIVSASLSGGVAMVPEDGDRPDLIVARAELALRKMHGDDVSGFKFYTPRLDRVEEGRIRLEAELRDGVAKKEFKAAFQPKICFRTGQIKAFEALARWRRDGGKVISPAAFIPLAEETGLIRQIGDDILVQSCRRAREWIDDGILASVAVNVSPLQLEQRRFVDCVIDALRDSGLPPRFLELEITESLAVGDPQMVADVMRPLRAMGVKLAIDDFGTGHSNLSILSKLPFSTFKIDRQFVSALDTDAQAPAIVEMILAMAETLGLETVAEGVETPNQADFLRRRGCTLGQGYLYSPALAGDDVAGFAARWKDADTGGAPKRAMGAV